MFHANWASLSVVGCVAGLNLVQSPFLAEPTFGSIACGCFLAHSFIVVVRAASMLDCPVSSEASVQQGGYLQHLFPLELDLD